MLWDITPLWPVAVVALVLWFWQNVQHEGMHVLVLWHWGAEITGFKPYPTWNSSLGLCFARMGYRIPAGVGFNSTMEGVGFIAPQAANTLILLMLLAVSRFDLPYGVEVALAGLYISNFVDGAYNLGTFYRPEPDVKLTDGWSFQRHWGMNKWTCRICTALWHLFFGFNLFTPTDWAF
jgi:hypothetical protein